MLPKIALVCIALLPASAFSAPSAVEVVRNSPIADQIQPAVAVFAADWIARTPPSGAVSAPEFLTTLYPGQPIALAISAQGPHRLRLLEGATLHVRITSDHTTRVFEADLKPVTRREIKAEGADVVLSGLEAAGISNPNPAAIEQASSMVTFAVFLPGWAAPSAEAEDTVHLTSTLQGASRIDLSPVTLRVRPAADWLKDTAPAMVEVGHFLNRSHDDPPPGQLITLLRVIAANGGLSSPPMASFFAASFREHQAPRIAAVALAPLLDRNTRQALAIVFRLGGLDPAPFVSGWPASDLARLQGVAPIGDPRTALVYTDPVTPQIAQGLGATMDTCWGEWMATADATYVRALVGLLSGASDYVTFQAWQSAHGGAKGLNASVIRGLGYQIAGWSIGSFARTDPAVMDWLRFWEKDPAFPAVLRQELKALPVNPAFRRK